MKISKIIYQAKYKALLNSAEWMKFSSLIIERDNCTCQLCRSKYSLQAHHMIYIKGRKPWEYPHNYIITLCDKCHEKEHMAMDALDEYDINEHLLSGMLAVDIWRKLKRNESIILEKVKE